DFGQDNAITLTATFDKAMKVGKQRGLAINKVEFKDGINTLGTIATATQNADGKWVATLNVNTKDWTAGTHKLTAEYAGNLELGGSTTNEVTVIVNEVYAVYDGSSKKFCAATAESPKVPTTTEITDKKTINHLYIMGGSIPKGLMGDWQNPCLNLKTVICADTVTTIGTNAFQKCKGLTSVAMPNVTTIGNYAFSGCTSLTSVEMPAVITININAFYGCTSLASVAMPSATSIGDRAFNGCIALTSAQLPKVTTIGGQAFRSCTGLASVEMSSATKIDGFAFSSCTG
ncbi:MAG: leucine-rich repeat protein, partial [Oscillospiraceae bacterium]